MPEFPDTCDAAAALAKRVLSACRELDPAGDVPMAVPSERQLAQHIGVTRHAVRGALECLERDGVIRRLPGRGSFMVEPVVPARHASKTRIRCINFVYGSALTRDDLDWLLGQYLDGYTEVLDAHDAKARFIHWPDDRSDYADMLWRRANWEEQGCVLMNRRMPAMLEWLHIQGVRYVVQNHCAYDVQGLPPHPRICVNKAGAALEAVQHLQALGHRRIGFVGSAPEPERLYADYSGYQAAMACAGLIPLPEDVLDLRVEVVEPIIEHCRTYLDRPDRPTAIFATHGAISLALKRAATSLGLRVPEDLSLLAFDHPLTIGDPTLDRILLPRRRLAREAVTMLIELFDKPPQTPPARVLSCRMELLGSSTTAP